jgi:hypothetical protein
MMRKRVEYLRLRPNRPAMMCIDCDRDYTRKEDVDAPLVRHEDKLRLHISEQGLTAQRDQIVTLFLR